MIPDFDLNDDFARGLTVILAVRRGRLQPDETFEYQASTISKLQARIEAQRAAREQGFIVGYVVDYRSGA